MAEPLYKRWALKHWQCVHNHRLASLLVFRVQSPLWDSLVKLLLVLWHPFILTFVIYVPLMSIPELANIFDNSKSKHPNGRTGLPVCPVSLSFESEGKKRLTCILAEGPLF